MKRLLVVLALAVGCARAPEPEAPVDPELLAALQAAFACMVPTPPVVYCKMIEKYEDDAGHLVLTCIGPSLTR